LQAKEEHVNNYSPRTNSEAQAAILDLVQRADIITAEKPVPPSVMARLRTLEERSPEMIELARNAGVEIECLGAHPLFVENRVYQGVGTNWIMGPASKAHEVVIPHRERKTLESLKTAGLRFPLIYIAHETDRAEAAQLMERSGGRPVTIDDTTASELVGPVPAPLATLETGHKLARRSTKVFNGLKQGAAVTGAAAVAVAAAPLVLVGSAVAALSTLDPIVLGAIPVTTAREGDIAVWFVLARWDW
jgi:hypothetical protein